MDSITTIEARQLAKSLNRVFHELENAFIDILKGECTREEEKVLLDQVLEPIRNENSRARELLEELMGEGLMWEVIGEDEEEHDYP